MPNHTTNIMSLKGPRKELERFMMTVSSKNPELLARRRKEIEANIASANAALKEDPNDRMAQMNLNNSTTAMKELDDGKRESILDFDGTYPMPIELEGTTSPMRDQKQAALNLKLYGASDWYSWKNQFWGTKWGCYDVEDLEDNGDTITYRYQTAWSPAEGWLTHTSGLFPKLTFTNAAKDEGGDYHVVNTYENGVCTDQQDMEPHDWRMEYEPDYASTYTSIFEEGYEEGIKYAVDAGEIEWSMEEKLLEFIQNDDLPLFINFNWQNDDIKDLYSERLKSLDKEGSEKKHKEKKRRKARA